MSTESMITLLGVLIVISVTSAGYFAYLKGVPGKLAGREHQLILTTGVLLVGLSGVCAVVCELSQYVPRWIVLAAQAISLIGAAIGCSLIHASFRLTRAT